MKFLRATSRVAIIAATLCFGQLASAGLIVIDNTDSAAVAVGAWTNSTAVTGHVGTNYQHDGNTGKSVDKYFEYNIGSVGSFFDGAWQIEMNWTAHPNRASNVIIEILTAGITVSIDQTVNGGIYNSLGVFNLDSSSSVRILTMGSNGYVIADAFRFTSVPEPGILALMGLGLLGIGLSRRKNI